MIRFVRFLKLNSKSPGFTLLEMVLVILIIGILFGIAIPSFLNARDRSQARACVSNLRHIQDAKERWAMEHNKVDTSEPSASDLSVYLKSFPVCPGGGEYQIRRLCDNPICTIGGDHTAD